LPPAWEKAMRDAEAGQKDAEGGLKKLMRKVMPSRKTAHVISVSEAEVEKIEQKES